mmetsp:Transcript_11923/g.27211  ORF Transcript_11923/g.27211 Transcript_11923/m.27211 type:complete len:307 (+) Transcript_11923:117-1037(+)
MPSQEFASEGFDIAASGGDGVVYEIGGGFTAASEDDSQAKGNQPTRSTEQAEQSPIDESERLKALGNGDFKQGNYLDAIDHYTDAIEACPYGETHGPSGEEILQMRDAFEERNREKMLAIQRKEMEDRRKARSPAGKGNEEDKADDGGETDEGEEDPLPTFVPPRHVFGTKLAVYHANRAACNLHLGHYAETIRDCDIALLFNPTYVKAYMRRGTAHERVEDTEKALRDVTTAFELDPTNKPARRQMERLRKLEDERMQKLKDETMGKLKDLGNSILGNFGMSLDNFSAVQDPKTGGYSISYNQNK